MLTFGFILSIVVLFNDDFCIHIGCKAMAIPLGQEVGEDSGHIQFCKFI